MGTVCKPTTYKGDWVVFTKVVEGSLILLSYNDIEFIGEQFFDIRTDLQQNLGDPKKMHNVQIQFLFHMVTKIALYISKDIKE